jgi:hypothetical protein
MGRPTCETCPYWEETEVDEDKQPMVGECHRGPPGLSPVGIDDAPDAAKRRGCLANFAHSNDGVFPVTMSDEWCGEHPFSLAYVASLKAAHACEMTDFGTKTLSVRARKTLFKLKANPENGGDPNNLSLYELENTKGCGPMTMAEILNWARANGFSIKIGGPLRLTCPPSSS